jgi:hypothetical protein
MRKVMLGVLACAWMAAGAPAAHSLGATCSVIPSWCPAPVHDPGSPGTSTPEPGTLGLLALGAAASVGMLRRKKK